MFTLIVSVFFFFSKVSHLRIDLQIRSVEAVHALFEKFPRAFMDTLHVPLPNRWITYYYCHYLLQSHSILES